MNDCVLTKQSLIGEQERIPMRDAVDELRKLGIPVESIENQDLPI